MIDIVRYPWDAIYTTNYDNAIQLALEKSDKKPFTVNNIEYDDNEISTLNSRLTPVFHLHGCLEKFDVRNLKSSLVLTTQDYHSVAQKYTKLFAHLKQDFNRSDAFVFVGYKLNDFHLQQVFYSPAETKNKTFFINRQKDSSDEELKIELEDFGQNICVGRESFSRTIIAILNSTENQSVPNFPCFKQYERLSYDSEVPEVYKIREFLHFGAYDRKLLIRDVDLQKSDYHALRSETPVMISKLKEGRRIVLITGEFCSGKTIITEEICAILSKDRKVFHVKQYYSSIVSEVREAIRYYKNPVFVFENCFILITEALKEVCDLIKNSEASILMTARTAAVEAEFDAIRELRSYKENFQEHHVTKLHTADTDKLIHLIEQIGLSIGRAGSPIEFKRRYLNDRNEGSLASILIDVVGSANAIEHCENIFRLLFDQLDHIARIALTATLYIIHTGHEAFVEENFRNIFD